MSKLHSTFLKKVGPKNNLLEKGWAKNLQPMDQKSTTDGEKYIFIV